MLDRETKLEKPRFQSRCLAGLGDRTPSFLILNNNVLWHEIASHKVPLGKGALIVSIDIDVGNSGVGKLNHGKNDRNVNAHLSERAVGKFEEIAVPLLVEFFEETQVPATFAVRGQLLEVDASLLSILLECSVEHDIAAHGYYHREFSKLSKADAEKELEMISRRMKEFNIAPRTCVFPRNSVSHLELLEEHGYLCYRGRGGFLRNGMYVVRRGNLYDVHPSLFINRNANVQLLKKMLDLSISKRAPFHMWFHPLDFGPDIQNVERNISRTLQPFFSYAKTKEKDGLLAFHTMLSVVEQLQRGAGN
jgi:peptidoglycan/xylan/chitin deacetylase (PgdA/CDA1 family)